MPHTAYIPAPRLGRDDGGGGVSALRSPGHDDMAPLRIGDSWRPQHILELLGPAPGSEYALAYLLVACCVLEGPARFRELAMRLEMLLPRSLRRMEQMMADPLLEPRHELMNGLARELVASRGDLGSTRAHAANDVDDGRVGGMVIYDLDVAVHHAQVAIVAVEIGQMRNLIGVERALYFTGEPPEIDLAEAWVDRVLPSAPLRGIQLYDPPELGRVVVVYDDGRLAYDPLPDPEDDAEDDAEGDDYHDTR